MRARTKILGASALCVACAALLLATRTDREDLLAYKTRLASVREDARLVDMRIETIEREGNGVQSIEDARTLMDQLDAAQDVRALERLLQKKRLRAALDDKADHVEVIINNADLVLVLATIEELDLLPLKRLTVDDRNVVMIVPHVVRAERPSSPQTLPRPGFHTLALAWELAKAKLALRGSRSRLYVLAPGQRVLDDEDFMVRATASSQKNHALVRASLMTAAALWSTPRVVAAIDLGDFSDNGFHASLSNPTDNALNDVRARVFPRSGVVKTDRGVDVSFGFARNERGIATVDGFLGIDDPRVVVARSDAKTTIDEGIVERAKGLDPGARLLVGYVLAGDEPAATSASACQARRRAVSQLVGSIRATFGYFVEVIEGLAAFNEGRCVAALGEPSLAR